MAERAKSRKRQDVYEFEVGNLVSVDGTYFDDMNQPEEIRYSASLEDGHVKGRVSQQTGQSYRIEFEDGTSCMVPKERVKLVPYHRKQPNTMDTSTFSDDKDDES